MGLSRYPLVQTAKTALAAWGTFESLCSLGGWLGSSLAVMSTIYLGIRGWLQTADPVGAALLIIGLSVFVAALLGKIALMGNRWLKKRRRDRQWPVWLSGMPVKDDGFIYLDVYPQVESEKVAVVVESALGQRTIPTPPFSLPWLRGAGEYHHIPKGSHGRVRLCEFGFHGAPIHPDETPTLTLGFETTDGDMGEIVDTLSNWWLGGGSRYVTEYLFHIAVIGKKTGKKRDFDVLVRAAAEMGGPRRATLEVEVPNANPHGGGGGFTVLWDERQSNQVVNS